MFLISEFVFHYTSRKDKLIFSIKICIQVKFYSSSVALVTVLQNPVLPSHMKCDKVHCSVKHDCLDAGVVQIVTMTVLSTSYNTLACVNNIGVHLSVELNGDGRVQRDPGVRPPTALPPG